MITFACSACGSTLRVADEQAGKKARCPRCTQIMRIPAQETVADKAPQRAVPEPANPAEAVTLATPERGSSAANTVTLGEGIGPSSAPGPRGISIPGYEVLQELGRGGMGVIYKARQLSPRRIVALKMILAGEHAGAEQLARFHAEASAVARLQHPNIVQIHEVKEHNGRPFLTLEYVEGGSLAQYLKTRSLRPHQAARFTELLARAAHYAHKRGIVHRDLKPANILLAGDGEPKTTIDGATTQSADLVPKIADFGLAKQIEGVTSMAAGGPMTQSGAILGTPQYMAPEQVKGKSKAIGPHTDVYALGAILYELLAGRPPFQGQETIDLLMKVATEEPPPPRQFKGGTPRDLETICLKCLRKEPEKRYASAEDLADDLRRYQDGEPITARPHSAAERLGKWLKRRKELVYLFSGVFVVLLLTVLALAFANPFGGGADPKGKGDPVGQPLELPPDLQLIPRDSMIFATIRVGNLWKTQDPFNFGDQFGLKNQRDWRESQEQIAKLEQELGLKVQDIERISIVLTNLDFLLLAGPGDDMKKIAGPVAIFSFAKDYDWTKIKSFAAKTAQYQNTPYGKWTVYEPGNHWGAVGGLYPKSERILLVGRGVDIARILDASEKSIAAGPLDEALQLAAKNHHFVLGVYPPRKDLEFFQQEKGTAFSRHLLEVQTATLRVDALPPAKTGEIFTGLDAELRLVFADATKAALGMAAAKDLMMEGMKFFDHSPAAKQMPELVAKLLAPLRQPDWKLDGKLARLAVKVEWQAKDIENSFAEIEKKFVLKAATRHKLKQIGVALHAHHDVFKQLPHPAITDKNGKPLLSWRVAILPYVEQQKLHQLFKLEEPWDSPHNLTLLDKMPDVYKVPLATGMKYTPEQLKNTHYQAFVGANTLFDPAKKLRLDALPDGTTNTFHVVEAARAVPWTKPEDLTFDQNPIKPRLGGLFPDGFHALMGDAGVQFFPNSYTEAQLRPFVTFNDGITVKLP